jgi:hypothetical protein
MTMTADELSQLEYADLRQEERDRMNARLQFWQLYFGLASVFSIAFGVAGLRVGPYLLAVLPVFLAFLSRYIGHSEAVLKQIRKYLYGLEKRVGHEGYESYVRNMPRPSHGGYLSALRDAFLVTDVLVLAVAGVRVVLDGLTLVGLPVVVVELVAVVVVSCIWINGKQVIPLALGLVGLGVAR